MQGLLRSIILIVPISNKRKKERGYNTYTKIDTLETPYFQALFSTLNAIISLENVIISLEKCNYITRKCNYITRVNYF